MSDGYKLQRALDFGFRFIIVLFLCGTNLFAIFYVAAGQFQCATAILIAKMIATLYYTGKTTPWWDPDNYPAYTLDEMLCIYSFLASFMETFQAVRNTNSCINIVSMMVCGIYFLYNTPIFFYDFKFNNPDIVLEKYTILFNFYRFTVCILMIIWFDVMQFNYAFAPVFAMSEFILYADDYEWRWPNTAAMFFNFTSTLALGITCLVIMIQTNPYPTYLLVSIIGFAVTIGLVIAKDVGIIYDRHRHRGSLRKEIP